MVKRFLALASNCEDLLLLFVSYDNKIKGFQVLDCWLDKRSSMKTCQCLVCSFWTILEMWWTPLILIFR